MKGREDSTFNSQTVGKVQRLVGEGEMGKMKMMRLVKQGEPDDGEEDNMV